MTGVETYLGGPALFAVGAAFTGGILAGLSPCVYPMIPIVSAYVVSRSGAGKSRLRSFLLSLAYVVGMAAVYSLLGMVAALTGSMFGQISTSPWALLVVAIILLLFALNILDVVPFPARFSGRTWEPVAGGVPGAFLLGAASGLVASPCTTPVLFGLLTFVATSHSVAYGAVLLFAFSMGMGMLLLVVGTCSGFAARLPRPGRWMVTVKTVLGLAMLGLAGYYLIRAGQVWF
jgi:thiol:disulfide interchange protein